MPGYISCLVFPVIWHVFWSFSFYHTILSFARKLCHFILFSTQDKILTICDLGTRRVSSWHRSYPLGLTTDRRSTWWGHRLSGSSALNTRSKPCVRTARWQVLSSLPKRTEYLMSGMHPKKNFPTTYTYVHLSSFRLRIRTSPGSESQIWSRPPMQCLHAIRG